MASLGVTFDWDNLDAAFAHLEREVEDVVRGITVETWHGILNRTPQYLGRMVASYTYSLNAPVTVDRSHAIEVPDTEDHDELSSFVRSRGHVEAINTANLYNLGNDLRFRLGDTVWITNGVDHGEGAYSAAVELGEVRLRPANLPGQPVARTLDSIVARYGANVSKHRARYLRTLQITDY